MTLQDSPGPDAGRRVTVVRLRDGWEVREERDNQVVRRALLTDWHRVERALGLHGPVRPAEAPTDVSAPAAAADRE